MTGKSEALTVRESLGFGLRVRVAASNAHHLKDRLWGLGGVSVVTWNLIFWLPLQYP